LGRKYYTKHGFVWIGKLKETAVYVGCDANTWSCFARDCYALSQCNEPHRCFVYRLYTTKNFDEHGRSMKVGRSPSCFIHILDVILAFKYFSIYFHILSLLR
jgi:hypothetical protein